MKTAHLPMLIALLLSVHAQAALDRAEKYFQNLSTAERNSYISKARVLNPKAPPLEQIQAIDLAAELTSKCDFEYARGADGEIVIPSVSCDYTPTDPSDPFNGATPKFKCKFKPDGKATKVKYVPGGGVIGNLEVAQATLGSNFTHLMGITADLYCPVHLTCRGCPSADPWENERSQAPAVPGNVFHFDSAVVEAKFKGEKMTNTWTEPKPQGFEWEELRRVNKKLPLEERTELYAQREALMLWNVVIDNQDPEHFNQRLACAKSGIAPGTTAESFVCNKPIVYTHDFGMTFGQPLKPLEELGVKEQTNKLRLSRWEGHKTFDKAGNAQKPNQDCVGNLRTAGGTAMAIIAPNVKGLIKNPKISEEARALFAGRISQLTDRQILDVFHLARIREVSEDAKTEAEWLDVFKGKVRQVNRARCRPLSSGKTALTDID